MYASMISNKSACEDVEFCSVFDVVLCKDGCSDSCDLGIKCVVPDSSLHVSALLCSSKKAIPSVYTCTSYVVVLDSI